MRRMRSMRAAVLALAVMGALALPARAQTTSQFVIQGPIATVIWGIEQGAIDFDLTVVASNSVTPALGDVRPTEPRITFSWLRLSALGGTLIRRQWYGNATIPTGALSIASDLSGATLEAEVEGTLAERIGDGAAKQTPTKGRIQIRWVASADPANTTLSYTNQTAPFPIQFTAAGQGRRAQATVDITVDGMGGPLQVTGPGTLLFPSSGLLSLGPQ
jgi:hypothetical protein